MRAARLTTLLGILIVLLIILGLLYALSDTSRQSRILSINSFEECAAAGYPIMESYPEQCRTPDGRLFINENAAQTQREPASPKGCAVAGCSAQLCVPAEQAEEIVTTCEFRPEYACYRDATCEVQADGACGWTMTENLARCLTQSSAMPGAESTGAGASGQ